MSTLQQGLTPKMKPLSPKRSALIAALDVGTSKVACLIGRLKPNPNRDSPTIIAAAGQGAIAAKAIAGQLQRHSRRQ